MWLRSKINYIVVMCVVNDLFNAFIVWCSAGSLGSWTGLMAMKSILLLTLVYLTYCKGALLLNWWWDNTDHSKLNKTPEGTAIESSPWTSRTDNNSSWTPLVDGKNVKTPSGTNDGGGVPSLNGEADLLPQESLCSSVACRINKASSSVVRSQAKAGDTAKIILNERPIIGILSQEQSSHLQTKYPEEKYSSYIAASYVKDVESSGARVVPIMIGKDRNYYKTLLSKINGVFMPGGATYFNQSNGFADAGQHIYEIAKELNDAGDYFPIFGTCLGFELLIILASGRGETENRISCYCYSNKPLKFCHDFGSSKMFGGASDEIIHLLRNEAVTVNAHQFCVIDDNLKSHNLIRDWHVTSHSTDDNGVQFISSIEHKRYPFYGVQFHPEKPAYEWKLSKTYPHSANAVKANRYFMDFFTEETRKNHHYFESASEENDCLIYNYIPRFTGAVGSAYHQCYFFESTGTISSEYT